MLGKFVRETRESRGLNQTELAAICGLSNSFISRIESGKYKALTVDSLSALARGLQVPFNDLKKIVQTNRSVIPIYPVYDKTPDEIMKELNASLPANIPVYDDIDSKYVITYIPVAKVIIGGGKVQGIISKSDFEDDIKKGDILLCSQSIEPLNGNLVICQSDNGQLIKRYDRNTRDKCCVIVQSIRNFRTVE